MDSDYLKATVGDALAAALTSLALKQPKEPLDFLGQYLIKYADYLESESKKTDVLKALEAEQAEMNAAKEKARVAAEEVAAQAQVKRTLEQEKVASLYTTTDEKAILETVVAAVKEATGASNVYVGKKIQLPEAAPYIKYVAGSAGNEWMVGKVLRGALPGAEEEGAGDEGVTFRLYKELPPPPEGEEEAATPLEEGEEAAPKPPAFPPYVHIENVIREPGVKFFGVPKLAAYLAVPVRFESGLHDEGIGAPPPATDEGSIDVSQSISQSTAGEEGAEVPAPAPATPAPVPQQVKVGRTMEWVLGLDTFDQARKFNHTEIGSALQWAGHLGAALQAAQDALWTQEKDRTNAIIAEEAELRARVSGELRGAGEEALKAVDGMEDGAAKKLKEKLAVLAIVQGLLSGQLAYLSKLSTCLIRPKAPHLLRLLTVALSLTKRSKGVSGDELQLWECVRLHVGEAFWAHVAAMTPKEEDGASLLSKAEIDKVRASMEAVPESELEGGAVESLLLFKWVGCLLESTEAIYEKKEADAAAAIAAAEAAAAAAEAE